MSATTDPDNQLNAQIAKLELDGVTTVFNQVSGFGISWTVDQTATGTSDQGVPLYAYRSGPPQYGDLVCEAQLSTTDNSLFTWWEAIAAGQLTPKNGTLIISDVLNAPTATFTIVGAVMTSLEVTAHSCQIPTAAGLTAVLSCLSYTRMS